MKKTLLLTVAVSVLLSSAVPALAQRGRGGGANAAPSEEVPEEGIPVTDALVISKCGTCHAKDAKGNLGRISYERTTPEGWEEAIKRMVRLNGLVISPGDARSIVKYLATYHGLAPEEAKPVMYMPEHRVQDETIIPNDGVRTACATCHPPAAACPGGVRRKTGDCWKYACSALRTGGSAFPARRRSGRRRWWCSAGSCWHASRSRTG